MSKQSYLRTVEQYWDGEEGLSKTFAGSVDDVVRVDRQNTTTLVFAKVAKLDQRTEQNYHGRYGGAVRFYKTNQTWKAALRREQKKHAILENN